MGGTILGSINKGDTEARAEDAIAGYRELGLDALIAIGLTNMVFRITAIALLKRMPTDLSALCVPNSKP